MFKQLKDLEKFDPNYPYKINSRKETLINAEELYNNRNNVIEAFENGAFLFKHGFQKKNSQVRLIKHYQIKYKSIKKF